MIATINTTTITPTQMPALNIPAIAEQLLNNTTIAVNNRMILPELYLFILYGFKFYCENYFFFEANYRALHQENGF